MFSRSLAEPYFSVRPGILDFRTRVWSAPDLLGSTRRGTPPLALGLLCPPDHCCLGNVPPQRACAGALQLPCPLWLLWSLTRCMLAGSRTLTLGDPLQPVSGRCSGAGHAQRLL